LTSSTPPWDPSRRSWAALTFTVKGHEDRLVALERDMKSQKEFSNSQQQQLRSLTIRLLNVPSTPGETVNNFAKLRETVYNRFLIPLLTAAKENKIPAIPPPTPSSTAASAPTPPPLQAAPSWSSSSCPAGRSRLRS
jgi:hypothetical protein